MSLSSLNGKCVCYDVETTGLNPWRSRCFAERSMEPARPFAFAFTDSDGNQAYIRWEVDPKNRKVVPVERDVREMSALLGDPHVIKIGHNLAFDIRMSRLSGIAFDWSLIEDTLPLAHVYTGGSLQGKTHYALKPLAAEWGILGHDDEDALLESVREARRKNKGKGWAFAEKETHGEKYIKSDLWLGDRELCRVYALSDTQRSMTLFQGLRKKVSEDPGLDDIYMEELRVLKAVYRSENRGMRLLDGRLESLERFYREYSAKWFKEAEKAGGKGVNFNSPAQLVNIFCVKRKYSVKNLTDSGKPSIDAAELHRLSQKDRLAKSILEYKAGEDMLTKFVQPYRRFMVREIGGAILHPSIRQCGTTTGRMSCANPNLEQVAAEDSTKKKADLGLKPREALGPRRGHVWYMPDYSQMEVWVFAFKARDPILMKALLADEDVHDSVALHVWGKNADFEERRRFYRKRGKTLQFLKQYGGTAKAAADLLNCTRMEAQQTIDEYDERLPGVNEFIERTTNSVLIKGELRNAFGRKYLIDPNFAYRGVNYYVQGTCADMLKRAYIGLDDFFRAKARGCFVIMPVHDEFILEIPKSLASTGLKKDIVKIMQADSEIVGLPKKMPVKIKTTLTTWAEAEEEAL